ncbi:uncharacterized protein K489DRAFT_255541 [Dissoconium aciculare CBS 342.82]|uniref:Uncharacterized protein n=1 Tax=Dissoconium aciculare CBS 342.82 TaxID=1314786 RepID=A0A6J3M2M1_9PEZI|nr:uncharacterized protein K489DRAFT_255541 [Dissoconium aciculare CBS 342.82]KAF1821749.1 hypothetical protein K489DRAFT_255541 [Dissoconium aciculare CBS 342.82]
MIHMALIATGSQIMTAPELFLAKHREKALWATERQRKQKSIQQRQNSPPSEQRKEEKSCNDLKMKNEPTNASCMIRKKIKLCPTEETSSPHSLLLAHRQSSSMASSHTLRTIEGKCASTGSSFPCTHRPPFRQKTQATSPSNTRQPLASSIHKQKKGKTPTCMPLSFDSSFVMSQSTLSELQNHTVRIRRVPRKKPSSNLLPPHRCPIY